MFAARYFAARYYAPRYFPKLGDVITQTLLRVRMLLGIGL